jgi:hypothetical protein
MGPAVLLVGSALVIGSLFLPWYHADPRYDHYPPDLQPFVPMQSFEGFALLWFVLAAVPIFAMLVCLAIDATPLLRLPWLIMTASVCFGLLTLVAGGVGILLLILYPGFLMLAGTVPKLLDPGYFVSLVGFFLLLPGAILLMIGQAQVGQKARLGRMRAK